MKFYNVMKSLYMWAALGLITLSSYSCSEPASPFGQTEITLEALDASCTEVWLDLKFSNLTEPANVEIRQNGVKIKTIIKAKNDTLLLLSGFQPEQSLSFQTFILNEKDESVKGSNQAQITTLKETSQNFTWQTWSFGEVGSSTFHDVEIIDEDNIWAFGEIKFEDSSVYSYNLFNAVHWNGQEWELKKFEIPTDCSTVRLPPLVAGTANTEHKIYFTNGNFIGTFSDNGISVDCGAANMLVGVIMGIAIKNDSSLYVHGSRGTLLKREGKVWRDLTRDTDLKIQDMTIVNNLRYKRTDIFGIASLAFQTVSPKIYHVSEQDKVAELSIGGLRSGADDIASINGLKYYVVGDGIFTKSDIFNQKEPWIKFPTGSIARYYSESVDAQDFNDVVVSGSFTEIVHFNGLKWKNFIDEMGFQNGSFYKCKIYKNTIVAVGYNNRKAYIAIGRR
ncbi:MAG: hypothetical protein HRU80_00250 [Ignavibacteriales bacterium]|nr:MAG: hypothetical protein HRU80_00250 [Ignavibacteriales bacterium]